MSPETTKHLLSLHGTVRPQPAADWTGDVPLPESLARFYREVGPDDITIPALGNPYLIPSLAELWGLQAPEFCQ